MSVPVSDAVKMTPRRFRARIDAFVYRRTGFRAAEAMLRRGD